MGAKLVLVPSSWPYTSSLSFFNVQICRRHRRLSCPLRRNYQMARPEREWGGRLMQIEFLALHWPRSGSFVVGPKARPWWRLSFVLARSLARFSASPPPPLEFSFDIEPATSAASRPSFLLAGIFFLSFCRCRSRGLGRGRRLCFDKAKSSSSSQRETSLSIEKLESHANRAPDLAPATSAPARSARRSQKMKISADETLVEMVVTRDLGLFASSPAMLDLFQV